MKENKWLINSEQSDVLLRMKHSIIAYLASPINNFTGSINLIKNEIQDATVNFFIDINKTDGNLEKFDSNLKLNDFFDTEEHPIISFKSTSFQKINANINFLKGNLTINNITKTIELEAVINDFQSYSGVSKTIFEINGKINRKDFGLATHSFNHLGGLIVGHDIELLASLELTNQNN